MIYYHHLFIIGKLFRSTSAEINLVRDKLIHEPRSQNITAETENKISKQVAKKFLPYIIV